jgi:hypothetical protein
LEVAQDDERGTVL